MKSLETLADRADRIQGEDAPLIVAALVDGVLEELTETPAPDASIQWVTLAHLDGIRIYQRSLSFLLIKALFELNPYARVRIEHSLAKGLFCAFDQMTVSEQTVQNLEKKMRDMIARDLAFKKEQYALEEVRRIFTEQNMSSKIPLLNYRQEGYLNLYEMEGFKNYFYGYMVPSTGYLSLFELTPFDGGVILRHPTVESPMALPSYTPAYQMARIFRESEQWGEILGVSVVSSLNEIILKGGTRELINVAEALHDKKIVHIADEITALGKKLILIAGPSSSGKTTFADRLRVQLRVNGLHPVAISTDDYFVDRELTPRDEYGEFDFESIDALDTMTFNRDLAALLRGEEVPMPRFNFKTGLREYDGRTLKISEKQPIIIEGIHGLNERLTDQIPKEDKFKIYISALTQLNIDEHNRIPTTDNRLIRRIVRDHQFRGYDVQHTIGMWHSVRRGEERNIFPFQEDADAIFNSALPYELAVLKKHVEPLLSKIPIGDPAYAEANRLLKFIGYFTSIEANCLVPSTSILKEFIGDHC